MVPYKLGTAGQGGKVVKQSDIYIRWSRIKIDYLGLNTLNEVQDSRFSITNVQQNYYFCMIWLKDGQVCNIHNHFLVCIG